MKNKYYYFIAFISILIFAAYIFIPSAKMHRECAFCDEKILENQKFFENDTVIALYTHKPVLPGHCLIIPKRHVERFEELSDQEMVAITHLIKRVNRSVSELFGTSAYLLLQKNGEEVGQTVPHVHFHYIPRKKGDDSAISFLFNFYISLFKSPISAEEMNDVVGKLKILTTTDEL
jgi:histidine triad (HIT) family protein